MGASNNERENSTETLIAVFSEKIEQMWQKLVNIENNTNAQRENINDIKTENALMKRDIDELKKASDSNKNWLKGLASGLIIALAKILIDLIKLI